MSNPKLRFKREDGTSYSKWKNEYLNKCATFHSGLTYSPNDVTNGNSGVLVIRSTNIQNGILVYNDNVYVNVELPEKLKLQLNDTVMCVRNGSKALVGKNALVKHCDLDKTWGAFMTVIRGNESNCFIHHYLNSPYFKRQMDINAGTSTINQITSAMLNECILSIPTDTEEQQKIADFLSTVDEVIAQSEAEVQNLEQQKKGAMQKIFSQEVRFKREDGTGFPAWKFVRIDEMAEINPKSSAIPERFFYMDLGSISMGLWQEQVVINKENAPSRANRLANCGDVFFQSVRPYNMGHYYLSQKFDLPVVASTGFIQLRARKGYCNAYIYQLLYEDRFNAEVNIRCTGSNYPAINSESFSDIEIMSPCLEEQQKIADFLSAYDEAITYAKQELDKWKELKKGLLQQMFV
ncbi:MAG: restriction endonuclease subunit S [Ruminococcus sp.]|nr:restriction endonuclease subunit S [Ruminococcus sp.]